jgi:hypothetical protein
MRTIPAEMGNRTKPYVVFIPIKLYESDLIFGARSLAKDCGAVRCSTCIGFGLYGDTVVYSIWPTGSQIIQALAVVVSLVCNIWPYWLSNCTGFGLSGFIIVQYLALLAFHLYRLWPYLVIQLCTALAMLAFNLYRLWPQW